MATGTKITHQKVNQNGKEICKTIENNTITTTIPIKPKKNISDLLIICMLSVVLLSIFDNDNEQD